MKQKRTWSTHVELTGPVPVRPFRESLAAYAEAKARKKSERLARNLARKKRR